MVFFQTKNPKSGNYWRVLQWKMLVYFWAIWSIFWRFGIFWGHLVYIEVIWYILRSFGILCGHLVYFSPFWYIFTKKNLAPCRKPSNSELVFLRRMRWPLHHAARAMHTVNNIKTTYMPLHFSAFFSQLLFWYNFLLSAFHPCGRFPCRKHIKRSRILQQLKHKHQLSLSVARWFIFWPKIPIWVNFWGPKIGKCWCILWTFGILWGH
jgi:hypothetical protein